MELIGKLIVSLVIGTVQSLVGGFVFSKLWGWFISSQFNLPQISVVQSVGINITFSMLLVSLYMQLANKMENKETDFQDTLTTGFAMIILLYPIMLLSGYVWHLFL